MCKPRKTFVINLNKAAIVKQNIKFDPVTNSLKDFAQLHGQYCVFLLLKIYNSIFCSVTKLRLKFCDIQVPGSVHTRHEINTVLLRIHSAILFLVGKIRNRYTRKQTLVMLFSVNIANWQIGRIIMQ